MKIHKRLIAVLSLVCAATVHSAPPDKFSRVKLPRFDVLSSMTTQWVGKKMMYNGLPTSIQNFKSSQSVENLFYAYESKWRTKGFNTVSRSRTGDLDVLGIEDDGFYFSVQARNTADGGSEGSLIVSLSPLDGERSLETKFPIYPNSEILSVIESDDMGIRSENILTTNDSSLSANKHWLLAKLQAKGWVHQDFGQPAGMRNVDMRGIAQLNFQLQQELCQVTIIADHPQFPNRTMVVVNWIK